MICPFNEPDRYPFLSNQLLDSVTPASGEQRVAGIQAREYECELPPGRE